MEEPIYMDYDVKKIFEADEVITGTECKLNHYNVRPPWEVKMKTVIKKGISRDKPKTRQALEK